MDSEHARSLFLIGIVGVGMLGCGQRPHHGAQSATWTAAAGATACFERVRQSRTAIATGKRPVTGARQ